MFIGLNQVENNFTVISHLVCLMQKTLWKMWHFWKSLFLYLRGIAVMLSAYWPNNLFESSLPFDKRPPHQLFGWLVTDL